MEKSQQQQKNEMKKKTPNCVADESERPTTKRLSEREPTKYDIEFLWEIFYY